ncbi:MAG TPA: F0F1 ATP synthase subunit B [Smithella sp.]|jgi:F-type H+-transporting ATPase subunit b|nr:F0F1 ATP synthase subunit B [Smithella sp.]OQC52755.1 MAG: ATP synthase subunit b [Deltaproteobacteria bacterium ADurb.Bin022]HNQ65730.1 F0F1 ATP synthase subunit B [Smithella sp.]HOE33543.1 F0F1 ATP synthase subunit B [Smithella sp.]HOG10404.1 F0F1 ATP synthase subunit B [Smithella sp.]
MKKTISLITGVFVLLVAVGIAFASAEAEGGHHGADWFGLFKKAFNFVVLMGLLYWLLAAKVKEFFVGRRAEIKENLEKAVERKAEAEKKYREYSEKIDKASTEIDGIIEMIKAQGVTEKQKIIEDAERTAKKMKEDAHARIEQEMKKATEQLKSQAVELSVQMAEEILKKSITQDDHAAMVKEYVNKVVIKH